MATQRRITKRDVLRHCSGQLTPRQALCLPTRSHSYPVHHSATHQAHHLPSRIRWHMQLAATVTQTSARKATSASTRIPMPYSPILRERARRRSNRDTHNATMMTVVLVIIATTSLSTTCTYVTTPTKTKTDEKRWARHWDGRSSYLLDVPVYFTGLRPRG